MQRSLSLRAPTLAAARPVSTRLGPSWISGSGEELKNRSFLLCFLFAKARARQSHHRHFLCRYLLQRKQLCKRSLCALVLIVYAVVQNTFKNGMLPIVLPQDKVDALAADAEAGKELEIDLPKQVVRRPSGEEVPFEVNDFRKQCLINGWDDISLTLKRAHAIDAFEQWRSKSWPWLDGIGYKGKVPIVGNEPKNTDW
jgi:hypothetical protein